MNASVRLSDFYNAAAGSTIACTGVPETEPVLTCDEGARRLRSLVDGGDGHPRTGRGDLLSITGARFGSIYRGSRSDLRAGARFPRGHGRGWAGGLVLQGIVAPLGGAPVVVWNA